MIFNQNPDNSCENSPLLREMPKVEGLKAQEYPEFKIQNNLDYKVLQTIKKINT